MKTTWHKLLGSATAVLATAALSGVALADPVKWDFSDEYGANPSGLTYMAAEFCIAEVEKLAGGSGSGRVER